jgi:hypothetical protein
MKTLQFWEEASVKASRTKEILKHRLIRLNSKLTAKKPRRFRQSLIVSMAVNRRLLNKLTVKLEYYEERKRAILSRSRFDRILKSPVI